MKTITPKDTLKLVLFVLILFSAKTFSQFPNLSDDSNNESRIGHGKLKAADSKACADPCAAGTHEMRFKNIVAPSSEVTSKFGNH